MEAKTTLLDPDDVDWDEMLKKFFKHKGSIKDFCRANNISHHHLYYRRKQYKKKNGKSPKKQEENTFVKLPNLQIANDIPKEYRHIPPATIEVVIGKGVIKIPSTDQHAVSTIVNELIKRC